MQVVLDQPRPPASRAPRRPAQGLSHRRSFRSTKGTLEPRLAPPEAVARFRRRPHAPQEEVHDCAAVERNVALLAGMAKHAGIPWDLILSAELARHYKPDREAYLTAVSLLELKPEEVMMCAAHSGDLMSAHSFGLRTGFIYRPNEYGTTRKADDAKPGDFDVVSTDMPDFASKLGA